MLAGDFAACYESNLPRQEAFNISRTSVVPDLLPASAAPDME